MNVPTRIHEPLPLAKEGDEAWILSAEMASILARKINAFTGIQADAPLRIVKSDAGFRIVIEDVTS